MHRAASASPIPGPAPFTADLPPVPAPITAPIAASDVHEAEVELLRAINAKQLKALHAVLSSPDIYIPERVADAIAEAMIAAELAR